MLETVAKGGKNTNETDYNILRKQSGNLYLGRKKREKARKALSRPAEEGESEGEKAVSFTHNLVK